MCEDQECLKPLARVRRAVHPRLLRPDGCFVAQGKGSVALWSPQFLILAVMCQIKIVPENGNPACHHHADLVEHARRAA